MADFISSSESLDHSFIAGSVYYWQYYGLKQSPFEESSHFTMYYPTPNLQEHLNYLQQFCADEQPLLLIQGELGAGKTTLIAQFLSQLSDNITPYQIKARETITAAEFANQIALGFQLPIALDQPTLRERLDTELQALQLEQKKAILVIEDADLLPIESWVALTHLALAQLGQPVNLYMILTSESRLENQIQQFALEQGQSFRVPTLQLMPLSFQETQNYVKHRLIKSGLSEKIPFTKEMMLRIYELSDGIPGRINRVAQQMLIEMLKPDEERLAVAQNQRSWMRSLWNGHAVKFVSGVLLALVLLALVRFHGGEDFIRPLHAESKHTPIIIHNSIADDNSAAVASAPNNNLNNAANGAASQTVAAAANLAPQTASVNTAINASGGVLSQQTNTTANANAAINPITPAAVAAGANAQQAQSASMASANNSTTIQNATATAGQTSTANSAATAPANAPVMTAQSSDLKGPSTSLAIPPESSAVSPAATINNNVATNNVVNAATTSAAENSAAIPATASTPATDNSTATMSAPMTVLAQNQAPTTSDNTQVDAQATAPTTKKPEHHHRAAATDISASEHDLLQMHGYTLQILGARDAAVLQQVMHKIGLSKDNAYEFRTHFANKPWYVLVYGNYASSQQAKAAIKKLPKSAQQLRPWIRPLSSVHSAIKQR